MRSVENSLEFASWKQRKVDIKKLQHSWKLLKLKVKNSVITSSSPQKHHHKISYQSKKPVSLSKYFSLNIYFETVDELFSAARVEHNRKIKRRVGKNVEILTLGKLVQFFILRLRAKNRIFRLERAYATLIIRLRKKKNI